MNFWAPIFEEARRYQQEFVDNLRNFLNTLDNNHADQWHNQPSSLLWRWELRGLRITDQSRKDLYDLLVEIAPPGVLERALLARLEFQKQLAEKAEMQAAAKRAANESAPENRRPATVFDTSSSGGELVALADDLADATTNADASATDSATGTEANVAGPQPQDFRAWLSKVGYDKVIDGDSMAAPATMSVPGGIITLHVSKSAATIRFTPNLEHAGANYEFIQAIRMSSDWPKNDGVMRIMQRGDMTSRAALGGVGSSALNVGAGYSVVNGQRSEGWRIDLDYDAMLAAGRSNSPFYNENRPRVQANRSLEDTPTFFFKGWYQADEFITAVYDKGKNQWLGWFRWGIHWEYNRIGKPTVYLFYDSQGHDGVPEELADAVDSFVAATVATQTGASPRTMQYQINTKGRAATGRDPARGGPRK